jgi:hypothetical protein
MTTKHKDERMFYEHIRSTTHLGLNSLLQHKM